MATKGQKPVFVSEQQDIRSGIREFIIRPSLQVFPGCKFGRRITLLKITEKSDERAGLGGKVSNNFKQCV